ncbi:hypothetical protein [Streptomyces sp. NPDC001492]
MCANTETADDAPSTDLDPGFRADIDEAAQPFPSTPERLGAGQHRRTTAPDLQQVPRGLLTSLPGGAAPGEGVDAGAGGVGELVGEDVSAGVK